MYSDKIIKTEINDTIVRAAKLSPIKQGALQFKVARLLAPSVGSVFDAFQSKDRSLAYATTLNLVAQKATDSLFDELQQTLLGSLLNSENDPVESVDGINTYLTTTGLNQFDLMVWLFQKQLLEDLTESHSLKNIIPKVSDLTSKFLGGEDEQ